MATDDKKRSSKHRPRGVEILHEDRDVIVICKEAGVLSTPTRRDESFTAETVLTNYLRKGCARSRNQAYLVHRLDRETSGVMIFAKTPEAQETLKNNWKNNEKIYVAIVRGHLKDKKGLLTSYLAENEDQFVHSVDNPDQGKLSQTEYDVLAENATQSLLRIRLLTGRKNQIRVQFSEAGHPIVGDPKYGKNDPLRERLCLHAQAFAFDHPYSGKRLCFEAPLPAVFTRLFPQVKSESLSSKPTLLNPMEKPAKQTPPADDCLNG